MDRKINWILLGIIALLLIGMGALALQKGRATPPAEIAGPLVTATGDSSVNVWIGISVVMAILVTVLVAIAIVLFREYNGLRRRLRTLRQSLGVSRGRNGYRVNDSGWLPSGTRSGRSGFMEDTHTPMMV